MFHLTCIVGAIGKTFSPQVFASPVGRLRRCYLAAGVEKVGVYV